MSCDCCIELDTPQTIYDQGNDHYAPETDIFWEVFEEAHTPEYTNKLVMIQALWWKWRDYCIASCDTPKWVRGMADRLGLVGHKWDAIISKAFAQDTDLTSLEDRSYERIIQRTAIEGTDGDTDTITHTGSDTHKIEHESLPQTATDTTQYLDMRQTDTTTPGVTDTHKFAPNNQDRETFDANDTLTAITFSDMLNNYPNVLLGFVNEFDAFFIDRWYC